MAEYGTPINPAPVKVKRMKPHEADPETRRRMLAEALKPGPPVKTTPPGSSPRGPQTVDDVGLSLVNAYKKVRGRGKQIDSVVDHMDEVKRIKQ